MISLVLILFLIIYCIFYLRDVYSYWRKKGVAGPTPWPLVGNYGEVLFRLKTEAQVIQEIYDSYPEAKYVGMYIGTTPVLLLRDVAMIKQVFVTDYKYFPNRNTSIALSQHENSLFVSKLNENWKNSRKCFSSSSNKLQMRRILHNLKITSNSFLDFTEELVKKEREQDMMKLTRRYFFVLMSDTVLGKKHTDFDKEAELETKLGKVQSLDSWELCNVVELIFPHIMLKGVMVFLAKCIFDPLMNVISIAMKNRSYLKQYDYTNMDTIADIVLDTQGRCKLDDDTVNLHIAALAVGLTVPESFIATYFAFVLARNPDIQNRCYEEVRKALDKYNGELNFESLEEMEYLEMVVEEVFRKYGLSFVFDRICKTKYKFPGTDLDVDPGVRVYLPLDGIRRDAKYFPNPDNFIPERFAPENKRKIPDAAHMPFGIGPRNCIGKSVSKLLLMMSLADFVHRFKVEPSHRTPEELMTNPTYRIRTPVGGQVWMNVISRKQY